MRTLDNSVLRSLATCTTQAILRHVHDLRSTDDEDAFAARAGTAIHEGLAVYLRGNRLPDGTAASPESVLLDGYGDPSAGRHASYAGYRAWADGAIDPDRDWMARFATENVRRVLAAWIAAHPMIALPFTVPDPALIEVGFTVPLDDHGDIVLSGRLDGFVLDHEGHWRVLENKTTGRVTEKYITRFDLDSQASTYLYAALKHVVGAPHVEGLFLNVIELSKLPDSTRACKTHGVAYRECSGLHLKAQIALITRDDRALEAWRTNAMHLVARFRQLTADYADLATTIQSAPQEGTFTGACQYCQFSPYCRAGRPTFAMSDFLTKDAWRPF